MKDVAFYLSAAFSAAVVVGFQLSLPQAVCLIVAVRALTRTL
jgi:hypothetical protein